MAHKPSYSLNNVVWTTLPGHYRFGGQNKSKVDNNIELETDSGVEFIYEQFKKRFFELTFSFGETDLAAFEELHDAVGGAIPFWFRFNLLSEGGFPTTYFVLKDAQFRPEEGEPFNDGNGFEPFYHYTMYLRERLT